MGLEGVARAKLGAFEEGAATIRAGLALALKHELTLEAAEVYQRLGTAHEVAGDYGSAREALGTAIGLCELRGAEGLEHTCLSCMAYVLRELGDWDQVERLCADLIVPGATPDETLVADGVLGAVLLWRGRRDEARPLLERCLETAIRLDVVSMLCDSAAALAWLADADGDGERAHELCRLVLERWTRSDDHHYAVWGLRWSASWLARNGALAEARACAEALSAIAGSAGYPDALAALAHALGEVALAEGEPAAAAQQLSRAVELHEGLDIPFERAQILLRAGAALAAAGERDAALERLAAGHRLARGLGAAPLATEIAAEVVALGASLEQHLGRRAAANHDHAGLSRRELEVMRLAASGLTNREIAERLVLSIRTVDMHMRNILAKLRCRTRTEAARRASEIGLLAD
jgi:ATP/maltotriose-dependent transcriptional regulator MalT